MLTFGPFHLHLVLTCQVYVSNYCVFMVGLQTCFIFIVSFAYAAYQIILFRYVETYVLLYMFCC